MKKSLSILMLLAAFLLPWAANAQMLQDYTVTVDTTTFTSIASTGTALSFSSQDDGYASTTFPFSFGFGEASFATGDPIALSANGFIYLGASSCSGTTGSYDGTSYHSITAILQADGHMGRNTGAGAYYLYDATEGTLTFEYHLLGAYSSPYGAYSYQVVLHNNGTIEIIYDSVNHGGASSRTLATYLVNTASDRVFLTGAWAEPTPSMSYSARPLSPEPAHGLRYTFTRPIVTCPKPISLHISNLDTASFTLSWTDTVGASEYYVRLNNGTIEVVNDTFYTFTGLTPNTVYSAQVSQLCTVGDTSVWAFCEARTTCAPISLPWEMDFNDEMSGSSSDVDFIPCFNRFENGSYHYPYVSTTYARSGNALYFYGYSGSSYGNKWVVALPIIDTNAHHLNTVQIRFWARTYSNSTPGVVIVGTMSNFGDDNTFVPQQTLLLTNGTHMEFTVPLTDAPDDACCVAFKYMVTSSSSHYVVIDDITIEEQPTCPPIKDLTVEGVSTSGAVLSWDVQPSNFGEPENYIISYINLDDPTATAVSATSTNPYFVINGLSASTNYRFWVTPDCGSEDGFGVGDSIDFATGNFGCTNQHDYAIGNGSTTNSYHPSYSCYNYSYSQQIYTAAELGGAAGSIIRLSFLPTSVVSQTRRFQIYLAHTSATPTGFVAEDDATLVYNGTVDLVAGEWVSIDLTTAFAYNGVDNLMLSVLDSTGNYSCSNSWSAHSISGSSYYSYNDNYPYVLGTSGTNSTYSNSYRSDIIITTGDCSQLATCAAPAVYVTEVSTDGADITWVPGADETEWDVYYRILGDTAWTDAATGVSATTYTITGLIPGTSYEFRVVNVCPEGEYYDIAVATTLCAAEAPLPLTENMQSREFGNFERSCWVTGSTALGTNYPYPYVVSLEGAEDNKLCLFYNGAYMILPRVEEDLDQLQISFQFTQGGNNVRFLMGLVPDQSSPISSMIVLDTIIRSNIDTSTSTISYIYKFEGLEDSLNNYCVAFWDAFNDNYSFIDDLVLDYAPACTPAQGLTASNITANSADISWDIPGDNATSYIIEYGPAYFTPGTGTQMPASGMSASLTGLNHSTTYDVYVYTECSGLSETSNPSQVVRFTTPCMPITTFPYVMNFEGVQSPGSTAHILPNCWFRAYQSSYEPYVYYYPTYASSPSYLLYMDDTCVVAMPELGVPIDSLMISFHEYNSYTSDYGIIIGTVDSVTTGFGASFQPIDTIIYTGSGYYFDHVLYLVDYAGTANRLAFKNYNRQGYGYSYHYIDDVVIDRAPTCIAPQRVRLTSLTNVSADLAWVISQATNYSIEYGPTGFTPGTGTTTTSSTRAVSLTGLTPYTTYDVRIVGLCSATDHSDTTVFTFTTMRAAPVTTLPYFCDFADSAIANSWELVNDANNQWTLGSASYAGTADNMGLYVSDDDGVSNSYINTSTNISYAYRSFQLDSGTVYGFAFDWKANGESNYDYLRAFLAPAGANVEAGVLPDGTTSTYSFATAPAPAGWIDLSDGKLNLSTSWQSVLLDDLTVASGTWKLIFMWANDGSSGSQPPATIDNVEFYVNTCPAPTAVYASGSGTTYVDIDWTGGADCTTWQVEYGPAGHTRGTGTIITTSSHPVHITGLESLRAYDFFVRSICSADDTGRWSARTSISTAMCDNATTITSYDPTFTETTSSYSPIGYSFYNYGYVQTIIPADRLTGLAGDITAMAFKPATTDQGSYYNNMTVYLANVAETDLSAGWIAPSDTGYVFTKVIDSADFCYTDTDWQIHSFSTPFTWDGHSSVLVSVRRDNGSYSSGASFVAHTDTVVRMRYAYTDGGSINFDITYVSSSGSTSTPSTGSSTTVGDIHLISCGAGCLAPENLTADTSSYNSLTFAWTEGDSAEVVLMDGLWDETAYDPANAQIVTTHTAIFTDLVYSHQYTVGVRTLCEEATSDWTLLTVSTAYLPCFAPGTPVVSNETYSTADIAWTTNGIETAWEVHVFNTTYNFYDTVTVMNYQVTGLTAGITYNVAVSALCGANYERMSEASDTVSFTMQTCTVPTNVTVTGVTTNSATVSWNSTGATKYEIEYGFSGYNQGEGTPAIVEGATSYTITGLSQNTEYDVYVRAFCSETLISTWSEAVSFTTDQVGISDVMNSNVSLYPNPASQTVTVSGIEGEAMVSIVDLNGRTVAEYRTQNSDLTIDVTGYAQGAYFVRITGENTVAIRKLIVK